MTQPTKFRSDSGAVVVTVLALMIFFTTMLIGMVALAEANVYRARSRILLLQAQYTAESGADQAVAVLNSGNDTYSGTSSDVSLLSGGQYKAKYSTTVTSGSTSKEKIIVSTGKVYSPATATTPTYTRKIRVVAQRNSTSFSTGLLARNIIYIESGVKNVTAKDVYANSFVWMNKNTTNLIAENITVAGKNTGATNCSIGGSGDLVKPSTFYTSGQTKTKITTSFNNCITPPGNTSNSDFTVSANQSNVPTVGTTYIPWSQYIDAGAPNAQNRTCNDLSAALIGSPKTHTIPASGSVGTHYPDNGSGTNASCGTLGDVYLGSDTYNLNQNVHIRGSLCVVLILGCNPTFNNPSPSAIRWVFVEGAIDFNSVHTTPGSGPIVFISYGADPLTRILTCPYGGSVYIGNTNRTSAPAAYFVATNGLCIDKTKFDSSPALGGLSAKNIYIASNPGTPFDLALDPLFPVNQIPLDLAWRAIYYQRL